MSEGGEVLRLPLIELSWTIGDDPGDLLEALNRARMQLLSNLGWFAGTSEAAGAVGAAAEYGLRIDELREPLPLLDAQSRVHLLWLIKLTRAAYDMSCSNVGGQDLFGPRFRALMQRDTLYALIRCTAAGDPDAPRSPTAERLKQLLEQLEASRSPLVLSLGQRAGLIGVLYHMLFLCESARDLSDMHCAVLSGFVWLAQVWPTRLTF